MKIILFANTEWYLFNFRLSLAVALRNQGHEVILVSPPGKFSRRLEEAGFRWKPFPLSRQGTNPFAELETVWRLRNLYRLEAPDAVHHFTIKCVLYGSLAAHLVGIRMIINAITGLGFVFIGQGQQYERPRSVRDEPAAGVGKGGLRCLVKWLYRLALKNTEVIFQNEDDRSQFFDLGLVSKKQSSLIPGSGVDTELFTPTPEPPEPVLVLLPARMLWDKGVGEFVEAAKTLKDQGVAARFALVGDTDLEYPSCIPEQQLKEWQSEGIVEWWGWQDDMAAVYSRAHIVCLPSYREGLPRTLVEAAACGRPLVATDVPGCRSVVRQGENGLLTPVRNGQALAQALRVLILDPDQRREMGRRGREIVISEFSAEKILADTLQVYEPRSGIGGLA